MTGISNTERELARLAQGFSTPDAALVRLFLDRLRHWRTDDSSVNDLHHDLQKLLESIWFSTNENHALINLALARLHDTINSVPGMTVNERLVIFDLMDVWNQSPSPRQQILRTKILA
jgi:hypothetical protein